MAIKIWYNTIISLVKHSTDYSWVNIPVYTIICHNHHPMIVFVADKKDIHACQCEGCVKKAKVLAAKEPKSKLKSTAKLVIVVCTFAHTFLVAVRRYRCLFGCINAR